MKTYEKSLIKLKIGNLMFSVAYILLTTHHQLNALFFYCSPCLSTLKMQHHEIKMADIDENYGGMERAKPISSTAVELSLELIGDASQSIAPIYYGFLRGYRKIKSINFTTEGSQIHP